jgi:putative zinc finger/helix-turn-helix YgiT family protein
MRMNNKPAKKPYPWKCVDCRERTVFEDTVSHEVDFEHDGRKYHVKIDKLRTPRCKKCGLVHPDCEANTAITLAFLAQAQLLTPQQIRDERKRLNLDQHELAERLGVATATISRWENGGQIQQRSLDRFMRVFFASAEVRKMLGDGSSVVFSGVGAI